MSAQAKKLSEDGLNLLVNILEKTNLDKDEILNLKENSGNTENLRLVEDILDYLTDEFTEKGLQEDSEPTKYGIQVDDLITFYSNLSVKLSSVRH